jgi:predicted ATP-grasp superfamily ATP-dependent carboligase
VRRPELRNPQAVCAFAGWGDAGDASTGAARYLIAHLEGDAFCRFDPDEFYEFQARRPQVEFESGVRSVHWPENEFHVLHHPDGDIVTLLGEEPHLRWRAFTDEVATVLESLGVERVILMGAFLGQVAHTLPVPMVGAAADPHHLLNRGIELSGYEGPTGIVGVLTQGLGEKGFEALSVWAAVPHYLSNQPYPPAVHALVKKVTQLLERPLDLTDLAAASVEFRLTVDAAVAENDELASYVKRLERDGRSGADDPVEGLMDEIERFLEER